MISNGYLQQRMLLCLAFYNNHSDLLHNIDQGHRTIILVKQAINSMFKQRNQLIRMSDQAGLHNSASWPIEPLKTCTGTPCLCSLIIPLLSFLRVSNSSHCSEINKVANLRKKSASYLRWPLLPGVKHDCGIPESHGTLFFLRSTARLHVSYITPSIFKRTHIVRPRTGQWILFTRYLFLVKGKYTYSKKIHLWMLIIVLSGPL